MTKLSVNLNKVALLRNQRDVGYPDLIEHARLILDAGAHGITVHPRPDERHVRQSDIPALSHFIGSCGNNSIELNIEGYPSAEFLDLVTKHHCHQVTLVPDDPNQSTSDHGWDVVNKSGFLKPIVKRLQDAGRRVSLFLDPDPMLIEHVVKTGAEQIELYTGPYAENNISLDQYTTTATRAHEENIDVNAGHDLSLDNLAKFLVAVPNCAEVSIGHAITADALKMGWHSAVTAYLTAINYADKKKKDTA